MSKFIDSIIGHAVGDAMGVPTEFCIREYLLKNPVKETMGLLAIKFAIISSSLLGIDIL